MKTIYALLFFYLLFTVPAFSLGAPTEMEKYWGKQRAILAAVHDKKSADEAAEQLALLEKDKPTEDDSIPGYDWMPIDEHIRLHEARFYGSEALEKQLMQENLPIFFPDIEEEQ